MTEIEYKKMPLKMKGKYEKVAISSFSIGARTGIAPEFEIDSVNARAMQ